MTRTERLKRLMALAESAIEDWSDPDDGDIVDELSLALGHIAVARKYAEGGPEE